MDKKSGEELASTLDANPSEPIQPATPVAEPVAEPAPAAPVAEPAPAPAPAPVAGPAPVAAAPVKKKKTGLIVGVTIGALAVAGGGTAAAILLLNNNNSGPANPTEAIAETFADVLSGKQQNYAFDGTAKISAQGMNIALNFGGEMSGMEGKGNVGIDFSGMGMNVSASVDGVFKDNTAYIKAEGIKDAISKLGLSVFLGSSVTKSLQSIDGTWYKLPVTISTVTDYTKMLPQSSSSCDVDIESLLKDREEISELFKTYNFIKTEKYTGNDVEKKKSDLYKIDIDKEKLADFAEEIGKKYVKGSRCNVKVDRDQLNSFDMNAFKVLAEFDKNKISRIYMAANISGADAVIDYNISNPDSVKIEAPSNAKSVEELGEKLAPLFQKFGGSSFGGSFGGGSYPVDNCSPNGSQYATNCIDYDDDDYDYDYDDDDYDWSSSYDDDYDLSELQDALDQLGDYQDLLKNLDLDDLNLDDLDLGDYDSSDLSGALEMLKNLQ